MSVAERLEEKSADKKTNEPGYALMLSPAVGSGWWSGSPFQHKSQDTWHSDLHRDELITVVLLSIP